MSRADLWGGPPGPRPAPGPAKINKPDEGVRRKPGGLPHRSVLLLAFSTCVFGLDANLDVSQYGHTSWKYRDGFSRGEILNIVQAPDGYLWFGTAFGVTRFDGVRNVPWQPPNQPLPSADIMRLLFARDGTFWIGTRSGLASWKNGKLTQYAELAGHQINAVFEDRDGSIWVGAYGLPEGLLCQIEKGTVRCYPDIRGLGQGGNQFHEDARGNLWIGVQLGMWRWKPGPPEFYPAPQPNGFRGIVDGDGGGVLVGTKGGVLRLADGKLQTAFSFPASMRDATSNHLLRDRDGGLWVGTNSGGIVHFHQGRTDVFSQADGLTGDSVYSLFQDREGNIWAATRYGLDRFRELPVVTYSTSQGLSNAPSGAILAAKDGSIWFGTADGLNRLNQGHVTVYRGRSGPLNAGAREIVTSELTGYVGSLLQDSRGRIWVAGTTGVRNVENERLIPSAVPGGIIGALGEDTSGNVWSVNLNLGLFRLSPREEMQQFPWETFGHKDAARPIAQDPVRGGVWLGFFGGGVASFRDGQVRESYSAADGLAGGSVNNLRVGGEGALWVATDGGLSRVKDGRIATLTSKNGLPCDEVHWTIAGDEQSVWLGMPCGLIRVARAELDTWAANPQRAIHTTVFDGSDGARMASRVGGANPRAAKAPDGKLWFVISDGISVVDPRHIPFNNVPPPVHIEAVKVNGKERAPDEGLELSHKLNDLEIDYTALSFTNPDRVMFRYKLEGKDKDWQDVGTRRQAYYGGLPPKNYRFRVMASNNDGVWNEAGASWNFTIVPAYYQTAWFQSLVALAIAGLLWLSYRLRLQHMARQFNIRMEERVNERTRIARDLHDTLLQSFQGVLLKFHAVSFMLPDRPVEAGKTLQGAIEQARDAIAEGRDAVQGLRSSTLVNNDLAQAITVFGDGLCAD